MEKAPRIHTIGGLRGLAALLVVVDHAIDGSWGLGSWTEQNHGITLFALLTGFLLSSQFLRARLDGRALPSFANFLRSRAVRIFPAYWLALAVAALTIGLHAIGPGDVWKVLTLTQTFDTDTPYEGLIPTWSLSLFLSFYLFLPAWAWWRTRGDREAEPAGSILSRELRWLLGLVMAALVVRSFSLTDPIASDPTFSLFGRADWFAAGMILTVLVLGSSRGQVPAAVSLPGRHPGWAFAGALALTVASALVPAHLEEVRNQLDLAAAVLVVYGAVLHGPKLKGPQRLLASRPAQALGRWSYGIFLWGYVSEKAIADVFPGIDTGPLLVLTLAAGIALGAASWRWVERPICERLRRRTPTMQRCRSPRTTGPWQRPRLLRSKRSPASSMPSAMASAPTSATVTGPTSPV
ncbi:MAG: acyltransferase [Actinomycetota bacterium]|nr:acyltransferase [Actinomycetota bacterium]